MKENPTQNDTRKTVNLKDATSALEAGSTLAITLDQNVYTIRKASDMHDWRDVYVLQNGPIVLADRFEAWQLFNHVYATLRVPAAGWEVR
jgi:hypothetical protein